MPIYSYKCFKCGREFEKLVGVVDTPEQLKCPDCGSDEVEKTFSSFSVGKSSGKSVPGCGGPQCSSGCPSMPD